ncbi:osiris 1 [Cochliomyia hominivorax]
MSYLYNKCSYSYSYSFIVIITFVIILQILNKSFALETEFNQTSNTNQNQSKPRSLLTNSDDYVARNQKRCVESRSLVSCIKYKASKIVWKLATNSMGYFPNEYGRELRDDKRRIRFIQLGQPADEIVVFNDARSLEGDNEITLIFKFLKRAAETFGRNHGIQLMVTSDSGARITSGEMESRGLHEKKKRKWLIILPLIILMKIAHLKMTVVTLLFGVLGLNVLLVGGVGWLIHYLKFKTLCKIHPQLVQHHSHVYDSDPADYSQFVGSSFPGSYYSSSGNSPHEVGGNYYSKDWSTSKAYSGYNYLDTISKRLK